MNKVLRKFIIIATYSCSLVAQQRGQTNLFMRPPFESGSPERESLIRFYPDGDLSFIQVVPFATISADNEDLPSIFFPFGITTLVVAEDGGVSSGQSRDLDAENFNIKTVDGNFRSNLRFYGSSHSGGVGIALRQQVACNWWIEMGLPFQKVCNRIRFREVISNDGGGALDALGLDNSPYVASASKAFKQESWKYGKIDSCLTLTKSGIADIELKVGYQPKATDFWRMYGYGGLVIPTGNRPSAAYVFEPIVGNGHHWGLMYGSHMGINVWEHHGHEFHVATDIHTRYLFRGYENRSFDLKDKEFSRYIASYSTPQQAELAASTANPNSGTSGINLYTQPVKVFPGYSLSLISAMIYRKDQLVIEAGTNFYAKQAEKIEIDWYKTSQIKDVTGQGNTNPFRTMRDNIPCAVVDLAGYTPIMGKEIDPLSAANPALIQYTFYGAGGHHFSLCEYPIIVGLGASYTITATVPLSKWTLWGKVGVQY